MPPTIGESFCPPRSTGLRQVGLRHRALRADGDCQAIAFSIDKHLGRHVESREDALKAFGDVRSQVLAGTFVLGAPLGSQASLSSQGGPQPLPAPQIEQPPAETLKTYAEDWLKTAAQNLKASTVGFYRDHLENHVYPLLGDRPITDVTRSDCRRLITTAREKGLKVRTVAGIVRSLSTVLSQAVEDGHLQANPALRPGKYLRRGDEAASQPNPFTVDEAVHLVETAREHFPEWHAFVLTGLRTGLRLAELLALQWGDLDMRGRFISVQRSLPKGKLSTPKNHQQRRVDMSPQLKRQLESWRRTQGAKWLKLGEPRPLWVFPSEEGTPLDESNVRKAFNKVLDKADLHRRGPHQMRHTFASLLLQNNAPATYVSKQLGHRDTAITLTVYASWLPKPDERRDVDRLDVDPRVAKKWQKTREQAGTRQA
jgi:integrase